MELPKIKDFPFNVKERAEIDAKLTEIRIADEAFAHMTLEVVGRITLFMDGTFAFGWQHFTTKRNMERTENDRNNTAHSCGSDYGDDYSYQAAHG